MTLKFRKINYQIVQILKYMAFYYYIYTHPHIANRSSSVKTSFLSELKLIENHN